MFSFLIYVICVIIAYFLFLKLGDIASEGYQNSKGFHFGKPSSNEEVE